jgi:hypothetical protein
LWERIARPRERSECLAALGEGFLPLCGLIDPSPAISIV